jgi:hypothetical protein
MAVIVMGGVGKDAIVTAAINRRHSWQCCHRRRWLNPTAATVDDDRYRCRQQSPLPLPHSQQQQPPEASGCCSSLTAAKVVIVDRSSGGWRPRQ